MKLNFALTRLLKENALYAVALVLFGVILAVVATQQVAAIVQTNQKITKIQKEIADLNKQNETIVKYSIDDLDKLSAKLNQLLPNDEDYFSIFNSLEKMGATTGVLFTSFSSPFSGATPDGVLVVAEASGSVSSFLGFLDQYQLAGTRVATIENVSINPPASTAVFQLKFHSKPISLKGTGTTVPALDEKMVQLLQQLEARDGAALPTPDVVQQQSQYQSKDDPFGQ